MTSERTCPCKRLPLCLSSFTAAEYGDLRTLEKQGQALADRLDVAGYSPLHLAAQNGQVSATSLLLKLGCHVDGQGKTNRGCGATPLHRASFSGAIVTMRLLLDWDSPRCDILAKDTSFGDNMTPLHKASAGGRYMAVQLLLEAIRDRRAYTTTTDTRTIASSSSSLNPNASTQKTLLQSTLTALDSMGRTPLDIAKELSKVQDQERASVARWDAVAGYSADWDKCLKLLLAAELEVSKQLGNVSSVHDNTLTVEATTTTTIATKTIDKERSLFQPLPTHLVQGNSCVDCGVESGGSCLTWTWEKAFQSAVCISVEVSLNSQNVVQKESKHDINVIHAQTEDIPSGKQHAQEEEEEKRMSPRVEGTVEQQQPPHIAHDYTSTDIGLSCAVCQKACVAFFAGPKGSLVCKRCSKSSTTRSMKQR